MALSSWLRAARPLAHANIAPPILLGQALAGHIDPAILVAAHVFGVVDHLYIVFANDYADREVDALSDSNTPFSGGSRVLVEGKLRPGQLRAAAIAMAILLFAISILIAIVWDRPFTPAFAVVAIGLLWAYSYPPLRFSYRGGGEIVQALGVGVVLPLLGFYLQRGALEPGLWLLPLFVFGWAGNVLTSLPDTTPDKRGGKRTWPVRRGEDRARRDALLAIALGLALLVWTSPPLAPLTLALILAAPIAMWLASLRWIGSAGSSRRQACLRFVFFAAGAPTLAQIGWSIALLLGRDP